jgi:hypothetical protein
VTLVRRRGRLRLRIRVLLSILAVLGLTLWFPSLAQAAPGERILSFTAGYDLASDGSMAVTETIVWQFGPGEHQTQCHGATGCFESAGQVSRI